MNVREYARIQVFPGTWQFPESMIAANQQIGNAVLVNLGFHIGTFDEAIILGFGSEAFEAPPAFNKATYRFRLSRTGTWIPALLRSRVSWRSNLIKQPSQ